MEEMEARLAKVRPAMRNMLKGNPNVFPYTTFTTADKFFTRHPMWQQAKIESQRRGLRGVRCRAQAARIGLHRPNTIPPLRYQQESCAVRTRSVNKVMALLKKLNVDVVTRWRQAQVMLVD